MKDKLCSISDPPLVAVVTPVYNGGEYLEATMGCVQRQTYSNLVHVIVDNCSTDSTPDIIDRFRGQRVELISSRNDNVLPVLENWIKAISAVPAEASYMKILCADDLMRSNCIARFVETAETDDRIEVVLCDDVFIDKVRRANLPLDKIIFDGVEIAGRMLDGSISWLPYHHMFIRRHEEIQSSELFGGTPLRADLVAVVRSSLRGKLAYLHEPFVYTRWHANSVTSQYVGVRRLEALLECFDILNMFGSQCWDQSTFRNKREVMRGRLIRESIIWTLMGRWDAAREVLNCLRERKDAPDVIDCFRSIIGWVPYKIWKRGWHSPPGPELNEAQFISENF